MDYINYRSHWSGKSTTFMQCSQNLIEKLKHCFIRRPCVPEYHVEGITQSQVHPAIGYTFAVDSFYFKTRPGCNYGRRNCDKETAELAIQAALTGHLVLATLHTNTAVGAIPRLIDMGIDPILLQPTLMLSIAQRLTRTFASEESKNQ